MIPGLPQEMLAGSDEEGSLRMKRMIYITDSMSAAELDSDGSMFMETGKDGKPTGLTWRVTRVAKGSGTTVREVEELLCQYRMMANMAKQAGGKNGWCVLVRCARVIMLTVRFRSSAGFKRCKRCRTRQVVAVVARMACRPPRRYKQCRSVAYRSRWFILFNTDTQRAMPPGMLQQMQRQLRSGGGMQEMMKAMMQGQGGDQLDMEEMQSILFFPSCQFCSHCFRQG